MKRKSKLLRKTMIKRSKRPMRRMSVKRQKETKKYLSVREQYLKRYPVCEVCAENPSVEIHHKKGRGVLLAQDRYFAAVCRECHEKIEWNRRWARTEGWLLDRLSEE